MVVVDVYLGCFCDVEPSFREVISMKGELLQCFGSIRTIFAIIPRRISRFDYGTFRYVRTGSWAWFRKVERHQDDLTNVVCYTERT